MKLSTNVKAAMACAAILGGALILSAAPANGEPSLIGLTPNPAAAGTTVTVTAGIICNNDVGEGFTFIKLYIGDTVVDGSFPGGTNTGTVAVPADTAPGTYRVEAQCSTSVGNSVYYPNTPLEVVEAPPTTVPDTTTSTTAAPGADVAAAGAVAASPAFTG